MIAIRSFLLKIVALVAIPFLLVYLLAAELYLDLTNIKKKGKNKKDG